MKLKYLSCKNLRYWHISCDIAVNRIKEFSTGN